MSQYPVNTEEGLYEAVNYLASGPAGLGQNFAGFSSFQTGYLTGNFRIPYSQPTPANLYVAPIDIDTAEMLDTRTIKITFVTPQAAPPFALGNGLSIDGVSVAYYNDIGIQIGVVECTTDYVIIRSVSIDPLQPIGYGGTVSYRSVNFAISTDCAGRVTVTGGTDRVFVSAQLNNIISYEVAGDPTYLTYYVDVYRLRASLNDDPTNPDYVFDYDGDTSLIAEKVYEYTDLSGTGTLPNVESIFTTIIDTPGPGYYRYEIEVYYSVGGDPGAELLQVTGSETGLRSLSAQVVKQ